MATIASIPDRVRAGLTWLDTNHPGWLKRINRDLLHVGSNKACILAQLFGGFDAPVVRAVPLASLKAMGFTASNPKKYTEETDALTNEWRKEIALRNRARLS